jgi:hypothetical protein
MKRIILFVVICAYSAIGSDPLPAARTPGGSGSWAGIAGIPGGIPIRDTIYTTLGTTATVTQVQSAINDCPSNQVVLLTSGTFTFDDALVINKSGVTLRGAGTNTVLNFTSGYLMLGDYNPWNTMDNSGSGSAAAQTAAHHVAITGGLTQGSTNLSISDATGYSVGNLILIDQDNDTNTTIVGNEGVTGSQYYSVDYIANGQDRGQRQLSRIYALSGTNITLSDPLYLPSWSTNLSPETWIFPDYQPMVMSGVESLQIKDTRLLFHCVYSCWATNVLVYTSATAAGSPDNGWLALYWSGRVAIQGCTIYGYDGPEDGYGFETRACGAVLFENNIVDGPGVPIQISGTYGSVFAYNFITNCVSGGTWMAAGILNHGGFPTMSLSEGNVAPSWNLNNTDSPSAYNVAARNWLQGIDQERDVIGNIEAVEINGTNRNCSVIGNVLGTSGVTYAAYEDSGTNCHAGSPRIYMIGYWAPECTDPYDAEVVTTLIRAYNWDEYNDSVVTGGYSSGDIPNSYYLTSKPSWFGALTWPPINPDDPTYSRSSTNVPAGYRYLLNANPPDEPTSSRRATLNGTATLNGVFRSN